MARELVVDINQCTIKNFQRLQENLASITIILIDMLILYL